MFTDSRPLPDRKRSCEIRIAELERALSSARERRAQLAREEQQADTVRTPVAPVNEIDVDVDFAEWVGEALQR